MFCVQCSEEYSVIYCDVVAGGAESKEPLSDGCNLTRIFTECRVAVSCVFAIAACSPLCIYLVSQRNSLNDLAALLKENHMCLS